MGCAFLLGRGGGGKIGIGGEERRGRVEREREK